MSLKITFQTNTIISARHIQEEERNMQHYVCVYVKKLRVDFTIIITIKC